MLTKRGYGGWNTNIWSDEWYYYSSTNSRQIAVLFSVSNPTAAAITWTVYFYYSCYGGWNEYASMSLNGANTWATSASCDYCTVSALPSLAHSPCLAVVDRVCVCVCVQQSIALSIPPGRTSRAMWVVGSGPPSGTRTLVLGALAHSTVCFRCF